MTEFRIVRGTPRDLNLRGTAIHFTSQYLTFLFLIDVFNLCGQFVVVHNFSGFKEFLKVSNTVL